MAFAHDFYRHCDELEHLPKPFRENWNYELLLLTERLPHQANVLQVGSMDGTRIMALLQSRPDLHLTGLEIEPEFVAIAQQNLHSHGQVATVILGDITQPNDLGNFDVVLCLNNTLGYIPDQASALKNMKAIGKIVILSVYGEACTNLLAEQYFAALGLKLSAVKDNAFELADFGSVRRYGVADVARFGGVETVTPLGYFSEIVVDGSRGEC